MQKAQRRRQQVYRSSESFWEGYAWYLVGEFKDLGKMLGIILLAIYLCVSMLVGMYTVLVYLFWVFWSVI